MIFLISKSTTNACISPIACGKLHPITNDGLNFYKNPPFSMADCANT
jgi:hypothetical protein